MYEGAFAPPNFSYDVFYDFIMTCMTLICIIAKLLTIKLKHMKKIFAFVVLLLLASCAVSENTIANNRSVSDQPICRQDPNCTNYGIHDHIFFD